LGFKIKFCTFYTTFFRVEEQYRLGDPIFAESGPNEADEVNYAQLYHLALACEEFNFVFPQNSAEEITYTELNIIDVMVGFTIEDTCDEG